MVANCVIAWAIEGANCTMPATRPMVSAMAEMVSILAVVLAFMVLSPALMQIGFAFCLLLCDLRAAAFPMRRRHHAAGLLGSGHRGGMVDGRDFSGDLSQRFRNGGSKLDA